MVFSIATSLGDHNAKIGLKFRWAVLILEQFLVLSPYSNTNRHPFLTTYFILKHAIVSEINAKYTYLKHFWPTTILITYLNMKIRKNLTKLRSEWEQYCTTINRLKLLNIQNQQSWFLNLLLPWSKNNLYHSIALI